jgi:HSP20 family protein
LDNSIFPQQPIDEFFCRPIQDLALRLAHRLQMYYRRKLISLSLWQDAGQAIRFVSLVTTVGPRRSKMSRGDLIGRYVPFEEFATDMERVVDTLLGRTVGNALRSASQEKFTPSMDISESPTEYEVKMDLPGVKPEDVKIEMQEGKLTVAGKREAASDHKEKNYHRIERSAGTFLRTLVLSSEVDSDKIEASYDHGVLHIKLPKAVKQEAKKIEIRVAAK